MVIRSRCFGTLTLSVSWRVPWRHLVALTSIELALACGPKTDLLAEHDESASGHADPGSAAPSVAALAQPGSGADDVPVNLAAVTVRFPVATTIPPGALSISGGGGTVAVGPPAAVDCPEAGVGACVTLSLSERLMPSVAYLVALGDGAVDDAGHMVSSGPIGRFITAADQDSTPPAILDLAVEPSGPCLLVGFQTDEAAAAVVVIRGDGGERVVPAGAGTLAFQVAVSIAGLGAGDLQVLARVHDLAGNVTESAAVTLAVPPGLLPVAITEIHANPAGPEPAQEFVEVKNLGPVSVDLAGLSIEDAKGSDTLPGGSLSPGGYALIVASTFDDSSPLDIPPLAGTPIFRVDARLGSDGLSNTGEIVRLRTSDGNVISSYSAAIDVSGSKWSGKSVHRRPEDACDQPASWPRVPAPATPGWGPP